jgi:dCTP diphosphatase
MAVIRPMATDEIQRLQQAIEKFARDRDWEQFHTPKNLAMAMSVEAAEVVEIFQWLTDEQSKSLSQEKVADLADELADTYIFLLKIAAHYGIDINQAASDKIRKNELKYPVEKARGNSKKYTEL